VNEWDVEQLMAYWSNYIRKDQCSDIRTAARVWHPRLLRPGLLDSRAAYASSASCDRVWTAPFCSAPHAVQMPWPHHFYISASPASSTPLRAHLSLHHSPKLTSVGDAKNEDITSNYPTLKIGNGLTVVISQFYNRPSDVNYICNTSGVTSRLAPRLKAKRN
jgi:hypothetical protein